jgi:hypothetical protein
MKAASAVTLLGSVAWGRISHKKRRLFYLPPRRIMDHRVAVLKHLVGPGMHSRKILLIAGDFVEDYEVMACRPALLREFLKLLAAVQPA